MKQPTIDTDEIVDKKFKLAYTIGRSLFAE